MRYVACPFTDVLRLLGNSVALDDHGKQLFSGSGLSVSHLVIEPEQLELHPEVVVVDSDGDADHGGGIHRFLPSARFSTVFSDQKRNECASRKGLLFSRASICASIS